MRVRIVKAMAGILDGTSLSQFALGSVYEVPGSLARQLAALGGARLLSDSDPASVNGNNGDHVAGGVTVLHRE